MRKKHIAFSLHDENASGILRAIGSIIKEEEKASLLILHHGQIPDEDSIIPLLRAATEADPTYATAYRVWGNIELKRRHFPEATGLFEKCIAANPKEPHHDMAWSHLQWAQELAKKAGGETAHAPASTKMDAVEHLKMALNLLPDDQKLISEISNTYESLGMMQDAAAVYNKVDERKNDWATAK